MHDVLPLGVHGPEAPCFRSVAAPEISTWSSPSLCAACFQPFHERDALHAARLTLWSPGRGIREHAHPSPVHRRRLIEERNNQASRGHIELLLVRTVVHDGEQIDGGHSPILGKSDLHPAMNAGASAADGVFLLAADAHHHRALVFLDKRAGMMLLTAPVTLLPNPPPVYALTMTTFFGSTWSHLGDGRPRSG